MRDYTIQFTSPNGHRVESFGPFTTVRQAEEAVFRSKMRLVRNGIRNINKWSWRII